MESNHNNPDSQITITTSTTATTATNTSPMSQHAKKKSFADSNQFSSSSSTKTSPRKYLHANKEQRRISQAKSIDIECVTDDDDGDERGSLIAQKTNYLSFDSDMLKHRPTNLRFNENSTNHQPIYDSDKLIANQENLTSLETKCLSNPILSNHKKRLTQPLASNKNNSNDTAANTTTTTTAKNENSSKKLQTSEKICFSSNNSVFFRPNNNKTNIADSQLPRNESNSCLGFEAL
jgi:hypothetical protein